MKWNHQDRQNVEALRTLKPEYTDRREMVTGYYDNGDLQRDARSGLSTGYIWVHDPATRAAVPAVANIKMADVNASGVRVKTALNTKGDRVAIEPVDDRQNAGAVQQLLNAAALGTPVPAANITGGRVFASSGGGLHLTVESLPEVGWSTNDIDVDSGDLPSGVGNRGWLVVYFPPGESAPTYAASASAFYETRDDIPTSLAFDVALPAGSIRTQAVSVYYGETDVLSSNTRIIDMRGLTQISYPPIYALSVDTTGVGNVGTGEDDLMSATIPADTLLADNDRLLIEAALVLAADVRIRAYLGATEIFDSGALTVALTAYAALNITITRSGTGAQQCLAQWATSLGTLPSTAIYTESSEDETTALTVKFTGEGSNDDDVVQKSLSVDVARI